MLFLSPPPLVCVPSPSQLHLHRVPTGFNISCSGVTAEHSNKDKVELISHTLVYIAGILLMPSSGVTLGLASRWKKLDS